MWPCSECDKLFQSKPSLNDYLRKKHNVENKNAKIINVDIARSRSQDLAIC